MLLTSAYGVRGFFGRLARISFVAKKKLTLSILQEQYSVHCSSKLFQRIKIRFVFVVTTFLFHSSKDVYSKLLTFTPLQSFGILFPKIHILLPKQSGTTTLLLFCSSKMLQKLWVIKTTWLLWQISKPKQKMSKPILSILQGQHLQYTVKFQTTLAYQAKRFAMLPFCFSKSVQNKIFTCIHFQSFGILLPKVHTLVFKESEATITLLVYLSKTLYPTMGFQHYLTFLVD